MRTSNALTALLLLGVKTVAAGPSADCNCNGVPDATEIQDGTSFDHNHNGIPDECDLAATIQYSPSGYPRDNLLWDLTANATTLDGGLIDLDIDGDGDTDVVTFDFFNGQFTVELNGGAGQFGFSAGFDTCSDPTSGLAGDLDGDGDMDVVTLELAGGICVHLNNGSGLFGPGQVYGGFPSDNAWALTGGDLDGDGDLDIAVANTSSDQVTVFLNDGNATFSGPDLYPIPDGVGPGITCGDYDDDGDIDLAVPNFPSGVTIMLNGGGASYAFMATFPTDEHPDGIISADLDGDGDLDLATANRSDDTVTILRNSGSATFLAAHYPAGDEPKALAASDADGDGDLDLAVVNWWAGETRVVVLTNRGGGIYECPEYAETGIGDARSISAADFEGDGDPDLVVGNEGGQVMAILLNESAPASADCNGNGVPDDGDIMAIVNFADPETPLGGFVQKEMDAGDLDGDGDLDLAVASHGDDNVAVLLNLGGGVYADGVNYFAGSSSGPWDVAIGDVDGDGDLDIAAASIVSDRISVLYNNGNGTFRAPSTIEVNSAQEAIIATDLDGDGDTDLAAALQTGWIAVLLNDGSGNFGQHDYPAGDSLNGLIAAHLNGDDHLDLAATDDLNQVAILFGQGSASFGDAQTYPVGFLPEDLTADDLDGDGDLDLAVANHGGYSGPFSLSIMFNDGQGSFSVADPIDGGEMPYVIDSADIDGDGDHDLAVGGGDYGGMSLLLNHGNGTFTAPIPVAMDGTLGVLMVDLSGDQRPDLAGSHFNTVTILLNEFLPPIVDDCNDNGRPDVCDIADGTSSDADGNGIPDECLPVQCPGDVTGDGTVDVLDLVDLIVNWGSADPATDIDGDGQVDVQDLIILITGWGPCG